MRILLALLASFSLFSCGSDSDDAAVTYSVPNVSYECSIDQNSSCAASSNGKEVRAAWFTGGCADFSSSTSIQSLGTTTAVCDDSSGCSGTSGDALLQTWTATSLGGGTYSLYIFIDVDGNQVPNNEPNSCIEVTLPLEGTNPHLSSFS